MRIFSLALIISVLFIMTACGSIRAYSGPALSSSEVATIKGHGVSVKRVNDQEIGVATSSVEILPGPNIVYIAPNASNYQMLGDDNVLLKLVLNAEAGKRYAITSKRGNRNICAFEIDRDTGKPNYNLSSGFFTR